MVRQVKSSGKLLTGADLRNIRTATLHSIPRNDFSAKMLRIHMLRIEQDRLEKLYSIWDMHRAVTKKQWMNVNKLITNAEKDLQVIYKKKQETRPLGLV